MRLFTLFVIALCLVSCDAPLKNILPFEGDKLTVNCLFDDQQPLAVMITQNTVVEDTLDFQTLQAKIFLKEDGKYIDTLPFIANLGKHISHVLAIPGKSYEVEVSKSGFTTATAKTTLPDKIGFSNLQFTDSVAQDASGAILGQLSFTVNDKPGDNYYSFTLYYYDDISNMYSLVNFLPYDVVLTDRQTSVTNQTYSFSDYQFQGTSHEFVLRLTPITYKMQNQQIKLVLVMNNLSPDYYYYNKTLSDYLNAQTNSFSSPVQVYGNITNGLGIFAGSVQTTDTIVH